MRGICFFLGSSRKKQIPLTGFVEWLYITTPRNGRVHVCRSLCSLSGVTVIGDRKAARIELSNKIRVIGKELINW